MSGKEKYDNGKTDDVLNNSTNRRPRRSRPPPPPPPRPRPIQLPTDNVIQRVFSGNEQSNDEMDVDDEKMPSFSKNRSSNGYLSISAIERCASYISCCNEDPYKIYCRLLSVVEGISNGDDPHQTIDSIINLADCDGVLEFVSCLGFEYNDSETMLICKKAPSSEHISAARACLQNYKQRFGITNYDEINIKAPITPVTPGFESFDDEKSEEEVTKKALKQIMKLVLHERVQSMEQDMETMDTLVLTHKMFTDSLTLLKLLRARFNVPIPNELNNNEKSRQDFMINVVKPIQIKVINVLSKWMTQHWAEDFDGFELVKNELKDWLQQREFERKINGSKTNYNFAGIKQEFGRLSAIKWCDVGEKDLERELYANVDSFMDYMDLTKTSASKVADQITLMDFRIFSRIKSREFTQLRWKKKDYKLTPNVLKIIDGCNCFKVFAQRLILSEDSLKKRANAITEVIRMGKQFEHNRNYLKLYIVFGALSSTPIHRLTYAWNGVSDSKKRHFERWRKIFDFANNHKNLREVHQKCVGYPCIPYIGIFFQDLICIEEASKNKIDFGGNQVLNFAKCVRIADRIKNIKMFQRNKYEIFPNMQLQKMLFLELERATDVSEDTLWEISQQVAANDASEARNSSLLVKFFERVKSN